jgi:hypothetical protein
MVAGVLQIQPDRTRPAESVDARRSLPIENVNEFPWESNEIHLQLSLLIHRDLGCRVKDAGALSLIRIVQVEFASRQVVGGRSSVPINFAEPEETVRNKANFSTSWGWNQPDVTDVITEGARDCDVTHPFILDSALNSPWSLPF